ncbi:restriction endonuclease subunit S [Salinibacter ruber]|uniref:restriction endonuclease subunit S n=1 Tax=Salinibacter ruber TaxID=146919 RepID=UPI002074A2DD|nr:restriction endonuclease subunit S [Salinibacter ruber]
MKITEKPFSIPDHWRWIELKELAEINPTFDRNDLSDDDPVSFVGMKRVEELSGRIDLSETEPLSEVRKGYTYFEDGDVLFAKITPCMENGKVAVARGLENGVGFGSTEFHVIRHPEEITQEWIFHYLIQEGFRRDAKRAMTGSAGQKRVPTGYIEEVPIPLPPLPEQRRIVAKIEELFSNLDAGMDDLQTAEQQLERYRLSVLQAAVEGRLTADWRETHDPESADQLLEQIQEERRRGWEKDYRMRRYDIKDKEPPSGWKDRYDLPEEPDKAELGEIPDSWEWVVVDQLSPNIHYGYTESAQNEPVGPKFLRITDIQQDGQVNWEDAPYCEIGEQERKKYLLEPGDILFARTGGTVGKSCLIENGVPEAVFASYLIRVITVDSIDERYVYLFFQTLDYWRQISEKKTGIGQPNVNATKLSKLTLPLPPLAEQKQIVDEVERLLSVADDASDTADREHTRADRLRQSILKQAFSGQLVPHDDEANPPTVDTIAPDTTDTPSSNDRNSDAEDLLGSTDPDKQIEMDI